MIGIHARPRAEVSLQSRKSISPFSPGSLVSPEFFVGRTAQLEEISRYARQACIGKLECMFLEGERNAGKTSLVHFVKELCKKHYDMLGLHVLLGGVSSLDELARRLFTQLLRDEYLQSWYVKNRHSLGHSEQELEVSGISGGFFPPESQLSALVREFPAAMKCVQEALRGKKRGIVLILDDLDGLADKVEFAHWCKHFTDSVAAHQWKMPMLLLLCGIPEQHDSLVKLQPSLSRILRIVEIQQLSDAEVEEFFQRAFCAAGVRVDPLALRLMIRSSNGIPNIMHEIGDAVFWTDADGIIDQNDTICGIQKAAEVIAKKYFDPLVYRIIHEERCATVLQKSLDVLNVQFLKQEVDKKLDNYERAVFQSFLTDMTRFGVLELAPECGSGMYRIINHLFLTYLRMLSGFIQTATNIPRAGYVRPGLKTA